MKAKKWLAVVVSMVMLLGLVIMPVSADEGAISVRLSLSRYGEFLTDKNGDALAMTPLTLSGSESYLLDDVLSQAHALWYDGADGYASEDGSWGKYLTKFWGDTSGNFGYQVNGEMARNLEQEMADGDVVEVTIYQSGYPDSELYTKFDTYMAETEESVTLTLTELTGFSEDGTSIFSPCVGASITIDGVETEYITDEDGKVTLGFESIGTYIISARKTRLIGVDEVPAICPPACLVEVKESRADKMLHEIAKTYAQDGLHEDGNMHWFLADIASYQQLFPQTEVRLSGDEIQQCVDAIVKGLEGEVTPALLAKSILALRSLGFDARKVYDEESEALDIVAMLTAMIDENDSRVTNIYTLPYVMLALQQGAGYMTAEQEQKLLTSALSQTDSWQNTEWGTDGATPMLLALQPYYEQVASAVDATLELVKGMQTETGLIGNAASTGLAIAAFSAYGMDSAEVLTNGQSLMAGLMSMADDSGLGFLPMENNFSTEQGFRGLLAWNHLKQTTGKRVYDFKDMPMNEAKATVKQTEKPWTPPVSGGGGGIYVKPEPEQEPTEEEKENQEQTETKPVEVDYRSQAKETFTDLQEDWYTEAVGYVNAKGLMQGTEERTFAPQDTMTRAMVVTVLYRMAGEPENKGEKNMTDVTSGVWYEDAVAWATEQGIVTGFSDGTFRGEEDITREQLAVILQRFSKYSGNELERSKELSNYQDSDSVSDYAKDAMAWAIGNQLIQGTSETELSPLANATRGQIAVIIMRYTKVTV